MKIAVASGKGGTGKTTIAVNLAYVASHALERVALLDCDVEEPNAHIFLKPGIREKHSVGVLIPEVDPEKCTLCGKCGEICQYNAIVPLPKKVLVYPELCHSCGGCALVCPAQAVAEISREIGKIEQGQAGDIWFAHGILNVGEIMSPPMIKAVKDVAPPAEFIIIDAPPGTSCPVIEAVRGVEYTILVTEPTPFGLHDLKLAVGMLRTMEINFGVVINRSDLGDQGVSEYCDENSIRILAEIPDDRRIAESYSRGEIICESLPEYQSIFKTLIQTVVAKTGNKLKARA